MRIEFPRSLKAALLRASNLLRGGAAHAGNFPNWTSRWARLMVSLLATWLAMLILLNIGLSLGVSRPFLAKLISEDPLSFSIDYRRAWSLWPTRVTLKDVVLCGSDANVRWRVEIQEARVSIDLWALFQREFHATRVVAHGIGFRLVQKLDVGAATGDRIGPLPVISEFQGPPLRDAPQRTGDFPKVTDDPWSVRIENVDGRAGQIWIDEFHFDGDVQVSGSFFLRPKRRLWVGPSHATIHSGSILIGQHKLLDQLVGSADCAIPSFDLGPPVGMQVFRFISGDVRLDANIPSARALDYYTRFRGSAVRFEDGKGSFHLDGALRAGVVRPLSLSSSMPDVRVVNGSWFAHGAVHMSADATAEGPSVWQSDVGPVELRRAGNKAVILEAKELRIHSLVDEIDLSKPSPDLLIKGEVPLASVPSLKIANSFLLSSSQLRVDGGTASISAQFEANTGTHSAKGVLSVDTQKLAAHQGELTFTGQLKANAHIRALTLENGDVVLSKTAIDARNVTLRDPHSVLSDWWGSLEIHDAQIRWSQVVPLDMTWNAKLASAAPVLAFSRRTPALPDWMTRFLAGGEVKASGRLRVGRGLVELSQLRARTGLLNVEGDFREHGDAKSGVFRVSAGPFSVGIELNNDETKLIFIGRPVQPPLLHPAKG